MKKLVLNIIRKFRKSEHGATAIEYGLIAALIAVGMIGGVTLLGKKTNAILQCTSQKLVNPGLDRSELRFRNCVRNHSR